MNESFPKLIEKSRSELPIEQQANFEGNWTNLMIERLRNPEIRKQIVDLILEAERLSDGKLTLDEYGDDEGNVSRRPFVARGRDTIEKEFDKAINTVSSVTPLTTDFKIGTGPSVYSDKETPGNVPALGHEVIPPLFKYGGEWREKTLMITESHEKGHRVRMYNPPIADESNEDFAFALGKKFWKAFDFEKIEFTDQDFKRLREREHIGDNVSDEEIKNNVIRYLKFPTEISERMSQLKNYFGMAGQDIFTKEHLRYAKKNYVKDTDFDNQMTEFFQAITPETEDSFIELINSAGI